MATGWQRFESDHDIYEELEDDLPENYNDEEGESTVIDNNYLYDDEIYSCIIVQNLRRSKN